VSLASKNTDNGATPLTLLASIRGVIAAVAVCIAKKIEHKSKNVELRVTKLNIFLKSLIRFWLVWSTINRPHRSIEAHTTRCLRNVRCTHMIR